MIRLAIIAAALALAACATNAGTSATEASETLSTKSVSEPVMDNPLEPQPEPAISPAADIPAPTYNEEVWYISGGWPSEYPPGFSVLDEDVVLMGRKHMHQDAARSVSCPVPQNASYQQWNTSRVEADDLEFVTVSEKVIVQITEDAFVDAPTDENWENELALNAGDTLTFLRYLAEGWSIWELGSDEYEIEEGALRDISDIETAFANISEDRLWVEITCADDARSRAWLLYDEVLDNEGIVMTPIIGFGESRDMTAQDRLDAIMQTRFYREEKDRAETENQS